MTSRYLGHLRFLDQHLRLALRLVNPSRVPPCCPDVKLLAHGVIAAVGGAEVHNGAQGWYAFPQPAVCLADTRRAMRAIRARGEKAIKAHVNYCEECPACDSHEQIRCMIEDLRAYEKKFDYTLTDDFTYIYHGVLQRVHECLNAYEPAEVDTIFLDYIKPAFILRGKFVA